MYSLIYYVLYVPLGRAAGYVDPTEPIQLLNLVRALLLRDDISLIGGALNFFQLIVINAVDDEQSTLHPYPFLNGCAQFSSHALFTRQSIHTHQTEIRKVHELAHKTFQNSTA